MIILSHILPVALASSCQLNNKGWWWPPPPLILHPPTRVSKHNFFTKIGQNFSRKDKMFVRIPGHTSFKRSCSEKGFPGVKNI